MGKRSQISQFLKLDWESSPGENPARGRRIIVDGIVLPDVDVEQIRGFSLCRKYSECQTRTIKRQQINKVKNQHGNQSVSRSLSSVNNMSLLPLEERVV